MNRFDMKGRYKLVLVLGNGFDKDLGLPSGYKDFENSTLFQNKLENVDYLKECSLSFKRSINQHKRSFIEQFPEFSIFDILAAKADLENWYDIERQLALIAHNRAFLDHIGNTFNSSLLDYLPIKKESFFQLHQCLKEYLDGIATNDIFNSIAFQLISVLNNFPSYVIVSSFNYTDLGKILNKKINLTIDHIHGNLKDGSHIIGIQDDIDIDPTYNYMIKSFSPYFRSHSLIYDLEDADEIIFFGHSLGETDYHYFKDFFSRQTDRSTATKNLKLSIFTFDQDSRMNLLQQIRTMNNKRTDMLYALCEFNLFMTDPKCNDEERITNFLDQLDHRLRFSTMIP